ncbi:MAG: hypothetical protein AB1341_09515 [Bacillota bacterium]
MEYLEWNYLLTRHFFKPEMEGKEVFLFTDKSTIDVVGSHLPQALDDFINAIKTGPEWVRSKEDIYEKAYGTFFNWRKRNYKYPPYVAYLAFFVMAWSVEGDYDDKAYYPRLSTLLGVDTDVKPQKVKKMYELWIDLEKWSKVDKHEQFGHFTARVRGNWKHIGLPLSQTLLTVSERKNLPQFFAEYNFDPTSPPSENEIINSIIKSNHFKQRTKRLLIANNIEGSISKKTLIGMLQEELQSWDGTVNAQIINQESSTGVYTQLKVCINYYALSETVKSTVRFKSNYQFPEEDIQFIRKRDDSIWLCRESTPMWSSVLQSTGDHKQLDASSLDWISGEVFMDETMGWKATLKPSRIKVFVEGKREKLPGWIEVSKVETRTCYLIACHKELYQSIYDWGNEHCEEFRVINALGLPQQWVLFKTSSIKESHPNLDILKLPTTMTARFIGGLKIGRGNKYYSFSPPSIMIEGSDGNEKLLLNGNQIEAVDEGLWQIPEGLNISEPLIIEIAKNNEVVIRRTIVLENISLQNDYEPPARNRFGVITAEKPLDIAVAGAVVTGEGVNSIPPYPAEVPTYLSNRIIFLGKEPGQINEWPADGVPVSWKPVWAVAKVGRDKWKAYFVGTQNELNPPERLHKNLHGWKKWKRVFIQSTIENCRIRSLAELWRTYKRKAKTL